MKYGFIEKAMWAGYKGTFEKHLTKTLSEERPKEVMKEAHKKYKKILADVTEFDKGDRFIINQRKMETEQLKCTDSPFAKTNGRVFLFF